jgi:hypothetical protein
MADLGFQIRGVEAVTRGMSPLLQFNLQISQTPATETIQAVMLHAQIQIQSAQRAYNAREKERLVELFGAPERWGQTLRTRLWTHVHATVPGFRDNVAVPLLVPCTYDLNVTAAKYLYALDGGEVALLFLFSGTIFYEGAEGRLQVQPISWDKECAYRLPVQAWRDLMEAHYPNSAWLYLNRDVFERLYEYKRQNGITTWDQTIESLLPVPAREEATV